MSLSNLIRNGKQMDVPKSLCIEMDDFYLESVEEANFGKIKPGKKGRQGLVLHVFEGEGFTTGETEGDDYPHFHVCLKTHTNTVCCVMFGKDEYFIHKAHTGKLSKGEPDMLQKCLSSFPTKKQNYIDMNKTIYENMVDYWKATHVKWNTKDTAYLLDEPQPDYSTLDTE